MGPSTSVTGSLHCEWRHCSVTSSASPCKEILFGARNYCGIVHFLRSKIIFALHLFYFFILSGGLQLPSNNIFPKNWQNKHWQSQKAGSQFQTYWLFLSLFYRVIHHRVHTQINSWLGDCLPWPHPWCCDVEPQRVTPLGLTLHQVPFIKCIRPSDILVAAQCDVFWPTISHQAADNSTLN